MSASFRKATSDSGVPYDQIARFYYHHNCLVLCSFGLQNALEVRVVGRFASKNRIVMLNIFDNASEQSTGLDNVFLQSARSRSICVGTRSECFRSSLPAEHRHEQSADHDYICGESICPSHLDRYG